MEDEQYRHLLEAIETSSHKPIFGRSPTIALYIVMATGALFAILRGYDEYQRVRSEHKFSSHYKSIGNQFLERGDYQRALNAFQEAEKLRPYDSEVYSGRVKAFAFLNALKQEDLDLAEVQCMLLLREDPNNAEAFKFLGIIYANKNNYPEAEDAFKKAINLQSGHYDQAEYNLARLYAEEAKKVSTISPSGANERIGLLQKAVATNNSLLGKHPAQDTTASAAYNNACDYALLRQPDEAISSLNDALNNGFNHYQVLSKDSDIDGLRDDPRFLRLLQDRYADINGRYQEMLNRGENSPDVLHVLGWIQLFSPDRSKLDSGIENVQRALSKDPKNASYFGTLARLQAASGKYQAALQAISFAIQNDPGREYFRRLQKLWKEKPKAR